MLMLLSIKMLCEKARKEVNKLLILLAGGCKYLPDQKIFNIPSYPK
jgi:hypothetical protein